MTYKWDGTAQMVKQWETDHTARTWLRESVGWYSQRLTPQLGIERIRHYLQVFNYGNQDFSGGIRTAWNSSTLKISAEEQVDFLLRLKSKNLNISEHAVDMTISLLPVAIDELDLRISGKTGTNFSWADPAMEMVDPYMVGWYVGYMTRGSNTYAFAMVFTDRSKKGQFSWAGGEARKIAVAALRLAPIVELAPPNTSLNRTRASAARAS